MPDGVDPHGLEQGHLLGQRGFDDVVRFGPQAVGVVLADGHVAPVHPQDHEIPAVDLEARTALVVYHLDIRHVGLRGLSSGADVEHDQEQNPGQSEPAGRTEAAFSDR